MYEVVRLCNRIIIQNFWHLKDKKIYFVNRPGQNDIINHRYLGQGRYVLYIKDENLIHEYEHIICGALAREITLIHLEEKVPIILRGVYRKMNGLAKCFQNRNIRRADTLAERLGYKSELDSFKIWMER